MATNAPSGPYKLVTVNTAPERAKIIIGRVVEAVKERYTIDYVANAESMLILLFFEIGLVFVRWALLWCFVCGVEEKRLI